MWPQPTGANATKDVYSLGQNPQYRLELKNNDEHAAVWIQLSRHITSRVRMVDHYRILDYLSANTLCDSS